VDNGNLVGLISGYKTADGVTHEMADVWFAKDVTPASTTTADAKSTVSLGDVLAAPASTTLPGAADHAATAASTATTAAASSTDTSSSHHQTLLEQKLLQDEEERKRHSGPLI
ncbi:hypothetical protein, partial [Pelomonas sp. KK5]|uniref:hypothetical protein n=1 Tax=Pelomonas sp. KK5 TaxID=1855730 RepID=UPI001301A0BC